MYNFDIYSQYYDLLYKDKDYFAESKYVHNLLSKFSNSDIKTILDLGCGSANHASHLAEFGFSITGIERSKEMLAIASNKNIKNFNPVLADIVNYTLNEKFDSIISLFHVISYLTDNDSLVKCFLNANHHLKKNGLFIFDTWFTSAVLDQRPETRVKRLSNNQITVTRLAEPFVDFSKNTVDVNYEVWIKKNNGNDIEIIKEIHPMRHFSISEIDLLARNCGFHLEHVEAFLSGEIPSNNTWGVCFILRKINE